MKYILGESLYDPNNGFQSILRSKKIHQSLDFLSYHHISYDSYQEYVIPTFDTEFQLSLWVHVVNYSVYFVVKKIR